MGKLIRFPLERRFAQAAAPREPEYIQEPGFFGVRIRPFDFAATPGINATVIVGDWQGVYVDGKLIERT